MPDDDSDDEGQYQALRPALDQYGNRDRFDRNERYAVDRDDRGPYRGGGRDDRGQYRGGDRDDRDPFRERGRDDRGPFEGRGRDDRGGRGRGGRGRGGRDDRGHAGEGRRVKQIVVGFRFLEGLQKREAADIVMTLSNPNTGLREALTQCVSKPDLLRLMINVLAMAFRCNSTPEQLNRVYIIIKECHFFDTAMAYFLDMQMETSADKQQTFKQPIRDMISIMEELSIKHPNSVTEFVGNK